jgi:hypothetical protein
MPLVDGLSTANDIYISKNIYSLSDSIIGFFAETVTDHYYSLASYNKMYMSPYRIGENVIFR